MHTRARLLLGLVLTATLALVAPDATACPVRCQISRGTAVGPETLPHGVQVIDIGDDAPVRPVAAGFLGLSFEYYALRSYTGFDPFRVNPVFLQLVRNLDPHQAPVLRLGGDSADWSWIPNMGLPRPPGAKVALGPNLVQMIGAIARDLNAKMILDLDLEADNPLLAAGEAQTLIQSITLARVKALEIGNEPELYDTLGWYQANGASVFGRPAGYDLADYTTEFNAFARALPSVPLAGPASGRATWMSGLGRFVATASRLAIVTVHSYPLQRCSLQPGTPLYPTISQLLAPAASDGLAASIEPQARAAHIGGDAIRVDELNSVSCFGAPGVSDTFASALWALRTSLDLAQMGVDGVNFHTVPSAAYSLFRFHIAGDRWSAQVAPEYYGLLLFAEAAPPGSHFLDATPTAGGLELWATRTPHGDRHVVIENPTTHPVTIALRFAGTSGLATVSYLRAARLSSTGGVTIGGRTFGTATPTGRLTGAATESTVAPIDGAYLVPLPPASATMLTIG